MTHSSDNSIDARLRDVPVPPGLVDRLKASLSPSDDELDEWLRRVAVPETLTLQLRDVPDDVALDERLADVPVPQALSVGLRLVSPAQRFGGAVRQLASLALAASWLLALTVTAIGGIGAVATALLPLGGGGLIAVSEQAEPTGISAESQQSHFIALETLPFDNGSREGISLPSRSALVASIPIQSPQVAPGRGPGAAAEWTAALGAGMHPLDDVMLLKFGVLGLPIFGDDRLPEIDSPLVPRAVGIQPPLVRGYDRGFFLKHRVFPPLSPAANPQLESIPVPLVTESDVLSRLARSLAEGRVPPQSELRTEDFVAAMNYHLAAAPAGRAALRTAAGPSPFGSPGTELLQVAVQAGQLAKRAQDATHLVLAIDLSQSMNLGGRLEMLQSGVGRLVDQLGPRDRLSLVVFHEEVVHQVELASRDDAPAIGQLLARLKPRGGTNLAAGLQTAVSLAMADGLPPDAARRLVLITDSQAQLPAATLDQLRQLLIAAGEGGVRLDVLDVGQREVLDPVLVEWSENLGGETRPVRSARQLYWSLLEALTGSGPVVASDARLTLTFIPQAVAAYRLIGHEANSLAEFAPASVQAELAAGEAASVLVELWFTPSEINEVGVAELTWRDASDRTQRVRQRISRLQFAPTLAESAPSLQQAAIAAEVGQELTGARDALRELRLKPANSRGLAGIVAASADLHPEVRRRPEFLRLMALVNQLEDR
ncbi:MAG: VWA domain-containing protein [Planctomycetaceae bacterium]|nr:VWA domain-containing protein [Planctomycetaceae bacterium]